MDSAHREAASAFLPAETQEARSEDGAGTSRDLQDPHKTPQIPPSAHGKVTYSGLRWGELTALTIPQVDEAGRVTRRGRLPYRVLGMYFP